MGVSGVEAGVGVVRWGVEAGVRGVQAWVSVVRWLGKHS